MQTGSVPAEADIAVTARKKKRGCVGSKKETQKKEMVRVQSLTQTLFVFVFCDISKNQIENVLKKHKKGEIREQGNWW